MPHQNVRMRMGSILVLSGGLAVLGHCSSSSGTTNTADAGSGAACSPGTERCPCYQNATCNGALVCLSGLCVDSSFTGSGAGGGVGSDSGLTDGSAATQTTGQPATGAGGSAPVVGQGGASPAGTPDGSAPAGGSSNAMGGTATGAGGSIIPADGGSIAAGGSAVPSGTGGTVSMGGSVGAGGVVGMGGASGAGGASSGGTTGSGGASSGGTTGSGGATPGGDLCNGAATNVIDNFYTCDDKICNLGGRSGSWYGFASADINEDWAVKTPSSTSTWVDKSCGAFATGGPSGASVTTGTYAGIGVTLKDGAGYDLRAYSGVTIRIESGQEVDFTIRDSSNNYFSARLNGTTNVYTVDFSSMTAMSGTTAPSPDLSSVLSFEFDAVTPTSFGMAVHSIILRP